MKKISEEYFNDLSNEQLEEVEQVSEKICQIIKENKELDEGLFGSIVGGLAGATIGPAIGQAICKALGVNSGILYNLLTSRAFTTMVATYIGYKQ